MGRRAAQLRPIAPLGRHMGTFDVEGHSTLAASGGARAPAHANEPVGEPNLVAGASWADKETEVDGTPGRPSGMRAGTTTASAATERRSRRRPQLCSHRPAPHHLDHMVLDIGCLRGVGSGALWAPSEPRAASSASRARATM